MKWTADYVSVDKNQCEIPDHLASLWEKIKPLALKAKYSDTCSGCYFYTKKIMRLIKPLIPEQDQVEKQQQKPENKQGNKNDVDAKTGQQPPQSPSNGKGKSGNGQKSAVQNGAPGQTMQGQDAGQGFGQGTGKGAGQGADQGQSSADALADMLTRALDASFNEHQKDMAADAQDRETLRALRGESTGNYSIITSQGDFFTYDEYNRDKTEVSAIINKLRTGLKNIINYNVDEMNRYLHAGKIDAKSLSRMPSGAICAKRVEKNDEADLNITVLVDMSGSMNGVPIYNARRACVVLQEVCIALKIPMTVLGFTSGKPGAKITHFANRRLSQPKVQTPPVQQQVPPAQPQTGTPEKKISMFGLLMHYSAENAALYKAQKEAKKKGQATPAQPTTQAKPAPKGSQTGFAIPGQSAPAVNQGFAVPGQAAPAVQQTATPKSQPVVTQQQQAQQQSVQSTYKAPVVPQGQATNFGETTVLGGGGVIGETTVLGATSAVQPKPHLIRAKNNEKINLDKPVFRIGKEKSYVDYFIGDNSAISRSHANIISRDGNYFVVDTNSTNHTYVNGAMIQSMVETPISHGAKIKLANEDFEFRLY